MLSLDGVVMESVPGRYVQRQTGARVLSVANTYGRPPPYQEIAVTWETPNAR